MLWLGGRHPLCDCDAVCACVCVHLMRLCVGVDCMQLSVWAQVTYMCNQAVPAALA